jgi:ABC-type sugar transport system permease subunit
MSRRQFFFFVGPSVLVMLLLMVAPLIASIWLSMHQITFRNMDAPVWIGLDNYTYMLNDDGFWSALRFTLIYIVVTVPVGILVGLVVALLLDSVKVGRGIYIAGVLLPFIVTPVVGTLVFRQIFDGPGLYPFVLDRVFGLDINFFSTQNMTGLIFLQGVWAVAPFGIIVLFAGLQSLPEERLEASRVDGANWFQRLWYIIIPHLRSLFLLIAIINIMDAYRVFDSIFVLTKQNPIYDDVRTLMYYNFQIAIRFEQLGRGNAMSILTVIGSMVILIPFLYLTYKQQVEEK